MSIIHQERGMSTFGIRAVTAVLVLWASVGYANDTLTASCFSSGFGRSSAGNTVIHSLVGQSAVGVSESGDMRLYSGFLYLDAVQHALINDPPVIVSDTAISQIEESRMVYRALVDDPDDTTHSVIFTVIPSWLDTAADSIFGTAPRNGLDTTFSFVVSDGSLKDSQSVVIHVFGHNQPPEFTSAIVDTATEGHYYRYLATAVDPNGTPPHITFENVPEWMSQSADSVYGTPPEGAKSRLFMAIATDGLLSDTIQVWLTVRAVNNPPSVTSALSATATEGLEFSYTGTATDPDNVPSIFYDNYPSWVAVTNDTLWGIPPEGAADTSFTIVATDGRLSDIREVTLMVQPVNDPPKVTSSELIQVLIGAELHYAAEAEDPEGDEVALRFHGLPAWLTAAGTSVSGTVPADAGDASFQVIASDGALADTLDVNVLVSESNVAPEIVSADTATAIEEQRFVYKVEVEDPDAKMLAYRFNGDMPAWLTTREDTLFGTPEKYHDSAVITLIVFDGLEADTMDLTITIEPVNDLPEIYSRPDTLARAGEQYHYAPLVADEEDTNFTLALQSSPAGMSLDQETGVITWTPADSQAGDVGVTISATDSEGGEVQQAFTIHVTVDGTPTVTVLAVDSLCRDSVRIQYALNDRNKDSLGLRIYYLFSRSKGWLRSDAVVGDTAGIQSDTYAGELVWLSREDMPDVRRDSMKVRIVPYDTADGIPDESNWFVLDNTPAVAIGNPTPAPDTLVSVHSARDIFLAYHNAKFDTSTLDTSRIRVRGVRSGAIPLNYTVGDSALAVRLEKAPVAGDTLTITLAGSVRDEFGKTLDGNNDGAFAGDTTDNFAYSFRTAFLGDYDCNDTLGFGDLSYLAQYWHWSAADTMSDSIEAVEIGPARGDAPHLRVSPDSLYDFEDLAVFMKMWHWQAGVNDTAAVDSADAAIKRLTAGATELEAVTSIAVKPRPALSRERKTDDMQRVTVSRMDDGRVRVALGVRNVRDLVAARYRVWCEGYAGRPLVAGGELLRRNGGRVVRLVTRGAGYADVALVRLSKSAAGVSGTGEVASLDFSIDEPSSDGVAVEYALINTGHETVTRGLVRVEFPQDLGEERPLAIKECLVGPNPGTAASERTPFTIATNASATERVQSTGGVVFMVRAWIPRELAAGETCMMSMIIRDAVGNTVAAAGPEDILPALAGNKGEAIYPLYWDCRNQEGRAVAPGVYEAALIWKTARGAAGKQRIRVGVQ